ncbi:hypothetical protein N7491_006031 [Penicillium cf. griseofulvum]|uniref:Uncharacterized protein n=1 Tax=Penicillium cf. griseofulvum TaxID=2972120 RepID=A0A9W9M238_9EURO|nr:hypothetical protein N7472_010938 [Penicillium cf. griseofulvum]KAJ5429015.1 hypothetical protein N7491_006031 [Penicillium cf. griseofulvum]KAJ5437194.1 hypothetical protein N7445_008079 [Penicillium cf. griseofulvum]
MAFKECNKAHVRVIQEDNTCTSEPDYLDINEDVVRQLAILKVDGREELVTSAVVHEPKKERQHKNIKLRDEYHKAKDSWDQCNTRACNLIFSTLNPIPQSHVDKVESAREAFKILRAEYGSPSWQTNFKRFETLCNIQYKGNNTQDFVRRFKEALAEVQQRGTKLDPFMTLNFFIRAIHNNPRCQVFIQALKPNLKDSRFMTSAAGLVKVA